MPIYRYRAIDKSRKVIKSTIDSASLETAKTALRGIGYTILEIREQNALNKDIEIPFLGQPKARDMAIFCRQFVSILRAGVPVSTVLTMLSHQTGNKKLAAAIQKMASDIEKGISLASAMRRHPRIFNNMLVNMVAAGEESGNLEESFRQMELYFERAQRTRSAVKKAMVYPSVLISVMVVVLIVMMTAIIPKFLSSFTEMGTELPLPTRMVIATSNWFVEWWWLLALILLLLAMGGLLFGRTTPGKHVFGWLARKIPVVKDLTVRSACAAFCRVLSLLISSGIPLTDALELASHTMTNICYAEAIQRVRTQVTEGWPLHMALRQTDLFPPLVYHMVGIGEESGDLQNMLIKSADYYDDEVEQTTQNLLSLMEPAIILAMAVFVVILVLSIFLPMLSMTSMYDSYL